ncbi:lipoprotein NlpD [Pigmentiphaga litoralis]|uniref:Lipoprotein NlpD n=2 Tax=Pigmentiphaga litoralis TaxID=516702 RepID=A0A7Y9IW02_9BURK|nr:peptidoglycan DD-metalloendopeptidase family protein [Pigmentiphaga litoralis]NYE22570.1 lipoprotein NlpD [Pigmentiphaga litoralis]NYE83815.1 lipoprotein NlpD [Pigmentiphaga litoralis]
MLNGRTPGVTLQEGRMAGRDDMFALAPVPWGQALRRGAMLALGAIALTACTTTPRTVSVVDRTTPARSTTATTGSSASTPGTTPDGRPVSDAETYVVKRGDTLYQIALDHGQDWRDIAQWSALEDANQLRVGQVLRVRRPGSAPPVVAQNDTGVAQTAPITGPAPIAPRPLGTPAPVTPPAAVVVPTPPTVPAPPATAAKPSDAPGEKIDWAWPAAGKVIENFNETRNKGLDIAGTPGDPILAAADGKVVYSGSGLRGYGNLIILKHNNTYLSAYAHNRAMLVKEGQSVKRGQKIAELGQTDAESPRLHFEIRRQGKPVDPSGFLPSR